MPRRVHPIFKAAQSEAQRSDLTAKTRLPRRHSGKAGKREDPKRIFWCHIRWWMPEDIGRSSYQESNDWTHFTNAASWKLQSSFVSSPFPRILPGMKNLAVINLGCNLPRKSCTSHTVTSVACPDSRGLPPKRKHYRFRERKKTPRKPPRRIETAFPQNWTQNLEFQSASHGRSHRPDIRSDRSPSRSKQQPGGRFQNRTKKP